MSAMHEYIASSGLGADDPCAPCYEAKSEAYRACQSIPATNRTARETCFRAADAALGQCLDVCGGQRKLSTGTLMLLGAGIAVLAMS